MSGRWHGGKGSQYRKVDQQKYNENWERVFGKKDLKFATAEEYINGQQEDSDDESRQGMGNDGADRSERSS